MSLKMLNGNLQSKYDLNWIIYKDGNRAILKCEQIITKIDKIVNNIK